MKIFFESEPIRSLIRINEAVVIKALNTPVDHVDDYVKKVIREQIDICSRILDASVSCSVFSGPQFDHHDMLLEGISFHLDTMIVNALKPSTEIAVFIGTCGDQIEKYSRSLINKGNALEGMIVDIIGSEFAEGIAGYIHKEIESKMAQAGKGTSNRYSPGYCNWPVNEQQKLFNLMQGNTGAVQLTSSSLMIPVKSVSGVIGLGKKVSYKDYACSKCDADYCLYREKRI